MRAKRIGIGRAIGVGLLWTNGAALVGFVLPLAGLALLGEWGVLGGPSGWAAGAVLIGAFAASTGLAWTGWSLQITRWRLWAYRRVEDVDALKATAVEAKLIWPEGHIFERTELRTRDQAEELVRLEAASARRKAVGEAAASPGRTTRLGVAGKSLFYGLALMPACMLAPAGVLQWVGIDLMGYPVYWIAVASFPLVVAVLIYRRACADGVCADEGLRRLLPRGIRREQELD